MLSKYIIRHLEDLFSEKVLTTRALSGGDINEVVLLITNTRKLVIKLNNASRFPGMFKTEAEGLRVLRKTNIFTIPEVISIGEKEDQAFLVLSYVEKGASIDNFWEVFGKKLAALHQVTEPYFGLSHNNYIGNLPQENTKSPSATEFYISQRLEPQFKLAKENGYSFANLTGFYKHLETEIPDEPASLVHGDLWNGNFIIDSKGCPSLIDPSISYAPREMDIAMMHLFGGFDTQLFEVYNESFQLAENWKTRMPIWQLYYLLVHLNLFGSSYYNSVKNILRSFS